MHRLLLVFFSIFVFSVSFVFAGDIRYGYNSHGNYVPVSIDGNRINYGYNSHGEYVPISVGDERLRYG